MARPVAEFNPDPRWPTGYFQVLEELQVPEKARGFYAHWIRQFFNKQLGSRRWRDLGLADIDAFIQRLSTQAGVQAWQVDHARDALEGYYERFRRIRLEREPSLEAPVQQKELQKAPAYTPVAAPRQLSVRESVPAPQREQTGKNVDWAALDKACRTALRVKHYALKTEKTYRHWIRQYVRHHHDRKPSSMGASEIHQFLAHLALN